MDDEWELRQMPCEEGGWTATESGDNFPQVGEQHGLACLSAFQLHEKAGKRSSRIEPALN